MKITQALTRRQWQSLSWLVFGLVLGIEVMVQTGWGLPQSLSQVMDEYVNLFRPQPWTFWIHFVILALTALSLAIPYRSVYRPSFALAFNLGFLWEYIQWLILHGSRMLAWASKNFVLAVLISSLYLWFVERLVARVYRTSHFQKYPESLMIPLYFHFGWLIVLMFQSLSMLGISLGLMRNGVIAMMWASGLLFLTIVMTAYNYVKYGSIWLMWPLVWFELGLIIDRWRWRNYTMMRYALVGLVITLLIQAYIYYLFTQEAKENQIKP